MNAKKQLLYLLLIIVSATSCVDSFWPNLGNKYEELLVVEGMISNAPGPYEIALSVSAAVGEPEHIPFTGCMVQIVDDLGNSESLLETEPGIYTTHANGIQGVVGRSYQLLITTRKGKNYASAFQLLDQPIGIDSVYWQYETRDSKGLDHELEGCQMYLNSHRALNDSTYLLWHLTETYKYNASYRTRYVYDGTMHRVNTTDTLYTCWRTDRVKEIISYNTLHLNEPRLLGFPLRFVSTETRALSIRYSLLVEQFVVNREAYDFWSTLKEQLTEQGSLYTKQPYQVRGNVVNLDDDDEVVFGYFVVAGQSQHRIFVDRPQDANFYYETECNFYTEELYILLELLEPQWPVLLGAVLTEYGIAPALPGAPSCIDCTANGGTVEEPDFWEK